MNAAAPAATHERPISEFERRVGHPPGLFVLFFAEMWERFSYYGMRALLVFYMIKGFLKYGDDQAYHVYGSYASMVYMTPFIGGLIADRLLGPRRAGVIGGAFMALGHLLMTVETNTGFYVALGLLIVGNGLFKPNISTMVGSLYHAGNKGNRDGGFTVFYMGINLGAALAPLLCGYIGENYGWHYGFGLATLGMLIGLAVFTMPDRVTQLLIGAGALAGVAILIGSVWGADKILLFVNVPIALALLTAAVFATVALQGGSAQKPAGGVLTSAGAVSTPEKVRAPALPADVGAPPAAEGLRQKTLMVLGACVVAVPLFALLLQSSKLTGVLLFGFGFVAFAFIFVQALRSDVVERQRLFVVLVMFFFSTLFWAFFEQAGSSMNNFADRNVDRVVEARHIQEADVGTSLTFEPNGEQLGQLNGGKVFTLDQLDALRKQAQDEKRAATITWVVDKSNVGMGIEGAEVPASVFQAANPFFILVFGLVFSALWSMLAARNREPSTPFKFALGLAQLSLGFGVLWYGAAHADARGMVSMSVLVLAYLFHTTGEICLSPVGLSMVTKLSPAKMVSTVMGGWFLATAFSENLAGIIATFTSVTGGEGGSASAIPPPIETVHVYGDVFMKITIAAGVSAAALFVCIPLLKKWMHMDKPMTGED